MANLTVTEKITTVESCLKQTCGAIYNAEINLRVAKKVDDKNMKDSAIKSLTKLEKQKDGYEEILAELKKEQAATELKEKKV